jgi:hypothetical protein
LSVKAGQTAASANPQPVFGRGLSYGSGVQFVGFSVPTFKPSHLLLLSLLIFWSFRPVVSSSLRLLVCPRLRLTPFACGYLRLLATNAAPRCGPFSA